MIRRTIWTNFFLRKVTALKVCSNFAQEILVDKIQPVLELMRRTLWTIFFRYELQLYNFAPTSFEKQWFIFSELFKVFFYLLRRKFWRRFFFWGKTQPYCCILTEFRNFWLMFHKLVLLDKKHLVQCFSEKVNKSLILLQFCPKNLFDVPQAVFHLMRRIL